MSLKWTPEAVLLCEWWTVVRWIVRRDEQRRVPVPRMSNVFADNLRAKRVRLSAGWEDGVGTTTVPADLLGIVSRGKMQADQLNPQCLLAHLIPLR